jgi:hypothetical protein
MSPLLKILSLLFISLLGSLASLLSAQSGILPDTVRINQANRLPCALKETSGLAFYDGLLWSFNDSGGKSVLYGMDAHSGKILRRIKINRPNHDWESIAASPEGLWIGDIGNNRGQRKDLQLFFLSGDQLKKSARAMPKTTLSVHYPEADFPQIKGKGHNRDSEAIAFIGDKLWLFTKNRLNTDTYLAPLSAEHTAQAIVPLDTLKVEMMVTGADYNESTDLLAICGYYAFRNYLAFIPLFTNQGKPFEGIIRYHLRGLDGAQIESVALGAENMIILSTEKTGLFPPQTFRLNAGRLTLPTGMRPDVCISSRLEIEKAGWNEDTGELQLRFNKGADAVKMEVLTFQGKRMYRKNLRQVQKSRTYTFSLPSLPSDQPVFVRIIGDGIFFSQRIEIF